MSKRQSFRILDKLMFVTTLDDTTVLLFDAEPFSPLILRLFLFIDLLPFICQVNLVIILRLNASFVPHVILLAVVLHVLVEDRPFKVR